MPGTVADDIELIIEDIRGNGGGKPPSRDGDDDGGGDDGGGGGHTPDPRRPNSKKYSTAVFLAMTSITVFFLVPAVAFLTLRLTNHSWIGIHLPGILWVNTFVLLASSATLEVARRKLRSYDSRGFRRMWTLTTVLGLLFVSGQVVAWRQLAGEGVYATSRLASSFFYVFTALHAAHLLGGIGALLYVEWHRFDAARISRAFAAEIASYYWHFMDGLWVFLLVLLYFGR
jgi:cytochrome c oxidase subunit 3